MFEVLMYEHRVRRDVAYYIFHSSGVTLDEICNELLQYPKGMIKNQIIHLLGKNLVKEEDGKFLVNMEHEIFKAKES